MIELTNLEELSEDVGFSVEDILKGYSLFLVDEGVEVVQRLDCLQDTEFEKFDSDTEAGEQALKDGLKLFTSEHEDLVGWYILDTPENRRIVGELK